MQKKGLLLTGPNLEISVILLSGLWELCAWLLGLGVKACGFPALACGREWSCEMPRELMLFLICDWRCFWTLIWGSSWLTSLSWQSRVRGHLNNRLGSIIGEYFGQAMWCPAASCVAVRIQGFGSLSASGSFMYGAWRDRHYLGPNPAKGSSCLPWVLRIYIDWVVRLKPHCFLCADDKTNWTADTFL